MENSTTLARDRMAVDQIMGHARDDTASVYRELICDGRLRVVTDFVHGWLFGPDSDAELFSRLPAIREHGVTPALPSAYSASGSK